ncbi:MAG: hypothetical protein M5R36_05695 [Deltaproteobacteria bacterium]|nr:hypothetical protein [Deltaproteobacteria bacterium]
MKTRWAALVTALALLAAVPASATSVLRLTEEQLFRDADLVVTGRVTATRSRNAEGAPAIVTEVDLRVDGRLKGACGDTITILVPGGQIGERGLKIMGAPEFETGDRVLLALDRDAKETLRVRGLFQGRFTLIDAADGSVRAVADPWRHAAADLEKCDQADAADCLGEKTVVLTLDRVREILGASH